MKRNPRILAAAVGVLILTLLFVSSSVAQCGGLGKLQPAPSGWNYQSLPARLQRAALVTVANSNDDAAAITGLWHVKFIAQGNAGGPPDGTEIDAGYAQWHSDGTEIMNSGARSPITSNFCLGVWESLGGGKYKLNHFAIAWDSTGANLIGPANIKEVVTLSAEGNSFAGTFSITQYDEAGNTKGFVQGNITGRRIGVNSAAHSIF